MSGTRAICTPGIEEWMNPKRNEIRPMSTNTLTPEQMAFLRDVASSRGVSIEDCIGKLVASEMQHRRQRRQPSAPKPKQSAASGEMTEMTSSLYYSLDEFVKRYGTSRSQVYREIHAGRVKARKMGKRTIITVEDAKAWFDSLPAYGDG